MTDTIQIDGNATEHPTPYAQVLEGLKLPLGVHLAFDAAAAVSILLLGHPMLAALGLLGCAAIDACNLRFVATELASPRPRDPSASFGRLAALCGLRATIYLAAPFAAFLVHPDFGALAYLAVSASIGLAIAMGNGAYSRALFWAFAIPPILAIIGAVGLAAPLSEWGAVGIAIVALVLLLGLISMVTIRTVARWREAFEANLRMIPALKAAHEQAEASNQRLRLAVEIADLVIVEVDYRAKTLTLEGDAGLIDHEVTFEDFVGGDGFVHLDDRGRARGAWVPQEGGESRFRSEYRVNRQDGREVWAATAANLTQGPDGQPERLVAVARNVTAAKVHERELIAARDQAESASQAKSAFLATMGHEIRTPLNGVLGMAQAMAQGELSALQRDRLDTIRASGEILMALLNDLLDVSKIEAGKLELEDGRVEIVQICRQAHAAFQVMASSKDVQFNLAAELDPAAVFRGDPHRVRQIVNNLLSNALKFTDAGEVALKIRPAPVGIEVVISDTGPGIAPDDLERLFKPFVQADASTTRRHGGTGLGLVICRELARQMGGDVQVRSRLGEGSTFTILLPLERLETLDERDIALASPGPAEPLAKVRVLAAEDNPINQLVLKTLLHQLDLELTVVDNGQQAVDAWADGEWDVVLMDVQMPVMDGPTATRIIRAREQELGLVRTPIIALTANAMTHQAASYFQSGMDALVTKPIELSELVATLSRVLQGEPAEPRAAAG